MRQCQKWTPEEDNQLRQQVLQLGKQWTAIAAHIPTRTPVQIAARWGKCLDPKLTKGSFTQEEDRAITCFVRQNGTRAWPKITRILPNRSPKQCRERWFNHLDRSVVKDAWTSAEDQMIFEAYITYGPKWSMMAEKLPGRTDNAIKNRWNSTLSKRVRITEIGEQILGPSQARKCSRRKMSDIGKLEVVLPGWSVKENKTENMEMEIDPADLTPLRLDEQVDGSMFGRDLLSTATDDSELAFL